MIGDPIKTASRFQCPGTSPTSHTHPTTNRAPRHARAFPPLGLVWAAYLLLFATSVPWYIPANAPLRIWLGLPHWVLISLLATLGVAVFTSFVIRRFWPNEDPRAQERLAHALGTTTRWSSVSPDARKTPHTATSRR